MHRRPISLLTAAAVTVAASVVAGLPAQAAVTPVPLPAAGATYTQDLDSLSASAASSAVPAGWEFVESGTSANVNGLYAVGTGSSNAGDTLSLGSGSGDRALGALRSGTISTVFGAVFTNTSGATVDSVALGYTGEQWRLGTTGRADRLDVQVSTDTTGVTTGTWTDVDALDLISPVTTGTVGARDGNAAANRTVLTTTLTGLSLAPGGTFAVRFLDVDASGADDALAVDDLVLTPEPGTPPPPPVDDAPAVATTTPAAGASSVPAGTTVQVGFSEPVDVTPGAFALVCGTTAQPVTVTGGPTTYTLTPAAALPYGATCTVTVAAASVTDQDAVDPPDTMGADVSVSFTVQPDPALACTSPFTPAYAVQGSGAAAAVTGPVTTQGVVVGDHEGPSPALRGFYLQDAAGDGLAETSDAVFVFNGGNQDLVEVGDVVRVTGSAGENQGQTQVSSSASGIQVCGTGTVDPTAVDLPVAAPDTLERYEGMLVTFPEQLTVTEHFQLGRFGQVTLSSGGRLPQPTNVVAPGAEAAALQAQNRLRSIILDDSTQAQNPDPILFGRGGRPLSASNTLRGGDTVTGLTGVMTYTWAGNAASGNAYRVRPVGALGGGVPDVEPTNPRPAGAPAQTGDIRVAGMNLLNFFTTFTGCASGVTGGPIACRGANNATEYARQLAKTATAVQGTGADVVGVIEIENDGYGEGSALDALVDELNARAGAGTYAYLDVDARTGQPDALGSDAIKVGLLYTPASVTPVGQTAVLNSVAFVNGGDPSPRNRPSLAQAFEDPVTGERFVVDVNHLKSKGSACTEPDLGDGQANCNQVRTRSAALLAEWLAADPTQTGEDDLLVVGDLNSYAKEDPIRVLEGAGLTNLVEAYQGEDAYSYVFDGQWGYLDHALGSASMTDTVSGVFEWHIDADEPSVLDYNTEFKSPGQVSSLFAPDEFRIADHDPVLVDLDFSFPFTGFLGPVDAAPTVNSLKAGQAVPLVFGLGGDQGPDVLVGAPVLVRTACDSGAPLDALEVVATGPGGLTYDPQSGLYTYVWKTPNQLAGSCGTLQVTLTDGSVRTALFGFR